MYDEDFATPDDHLLCALFDTAKLPFERTVVLYFKPSPKVRAKNKATKKPVESYTTLSKSWGEISESAMDDLFQ